MPLTASEKTWLDAYRKALTKTRPAAVLHMVLYGSKARGDDHSDSDLDVLLIIKDEADSLKRELRRIGYRLAATSDVVPSIMVYTETEWKSRKGSGSLFQGAVERDGIPLL